MKGFEKIIQYLLAFKQLVAKIQHKVVKPDNENVTYENGQQQQLCWLINM